ncbi:glycosyltransferase [Candidatus Parcubacteria bacterium]|nr:glycosyltransferase [Patescibacteria group bacterium]MBU4309247.1 glycosyltransferase [Patescibacteria group bacterium]MBU4432476.1 glycosyltransferase [Patescibacteria group bacterium]MBU4577608.1 glycosyltransferase [Patescibacteria group bacterium]MCG2697295.1 glycosyltransferase [Candidatus Parcubacteria bacterium]
MKILYIITKGEIGGAQQVVLNLARQQKKEGHDVVVGWGDGESLRNELQKSNIAYKNFAYLKRSYNPLFVLFFVWEIKKYLSNNNFDLVHFHSSNTLPGAIGVKISNKKSPKTIFTFHGLSVLDPNYETNTLKRIIFWVYFKLFLLFIDENIFVCNYNLETAKKIKLVKNGTVIYNWIDENELKLLPREEARRSMATEYKITNLDNKFIIGSIGRLAYPKNYEFLINIFPKILKLKPNAVCIIFGEGPEREKYEKLINKFELSDIFFLPGEFKNAMDYLKAFDLFVLPSKYEGMPMVLLGALIAETKILASNVGGNKEILSDNQLYNLDDEETFLKLI